MSVRSPHAAADIDPGRTVVFLHIPKTGGMTFRALLREAYGDTFHYCERPAIEAIDSALQEFRCIELHQTLSGDGFHFTHEELMRPLNFRRLCGVNLFSLFRDPVDHYLSLFAYLRWHESDFKPLFQEQGRRFPETLEDFIEIWGGNHQLLGFLGDSRAWNGRRATAEDLNYAKALMDEVRPFVGITERYADFLFAFEQVTGHQAPKRAISIVNKNPHRDDRQVDDSVRARIQTLNSLDMDLYAHVCRLVDIQKDQFGPAPNYTFD